MESISPKLLAAALPGQSKYSDDSPFKFTYRHPVQDVWSEIRYCNYGQLNDCLTCIKGVGLIYRLEYLGKIITNDS